MSSERLDTHPAPLPGPTQDSACSPRGRARAYQGAGQRLSIAPLQDAGGSNREALDREQRERRRLKESFENYRRWALLGTPGRLPCLRRGREGPQCLGIAALTCQCFRVFPRKRALRKVLHSSMQGEVDWENTTGSDNTDTEGS